MPAAVHVTFVGRGSGARLRAALVRAAPEQPAAAWVALAAPMAAPAIAELPAPPDADRWACALAALGAARVLYLAPGAGRDDDPGVHALRLLEERGAVTLALGPESAPASDGPTVSGPSWAVWRPDAALTTLVRGIPDGKSLARWRARLRTEYGPEAALDARSWSARAWTPDAPGQTPAFPCSLRAEPTAQSRARSVSRLRDVVQRLRGPDGCPWDRAQTHESLRPYLVEEAHEALAAIEGGGDAQMTDEFGDVLLQVVLHAEIARQRGGFAWPDVVAAISDKMVRRHPHVFGGRPVEDMEELSASWARIKAAEAPARGGPLCTLPASLPSLAYARAAARALRRAGAPLGRDADTGAMLAALDACDDPHAVGGALLWLAGRADAAGIDVDLALRGANDRLRRGSHGE